MSVTFLTTETTINTPRCTTGQIPMIPLAHRHWQNALIWVYESYRQWLEQTDLEIVYSREPSDPRDHGCPPPLPALGGNDHRTALFIDEQKYLWCTPANYPKGILDTEIPPHSVVEVSCMGTMFWLVAHAFLYLQQQSYFHESMVTIKQLREFKYKTARDEYCGFAEAAVELGWASHTYIRPEEIQFGDLIGIQRSDGRMGHWCIAWQNTFTKYKGRAAIQTLGASPTVEGVGIDPYLIAKSGRRWIGAAMFRK